MVNLSWSAPSCGIDAATATQKIRFQHDRIRDLLDRARAVAEAALDGHPPSPYSVASAIGDIHMAIVVHLTFEESVLFLVLRRDPSWGPERARRFVDEHARQRVMVAMLHREASLAPELPLLAAKLTFLTFWLRADMADEERRFAASV